MCIRDRLCPGEPTPITLSVIVVIVEHGGWVTCGFCDCMYWCWVVSLVEVNAVKAQNADLQWWAHRGQHYCTARSCGLAMQRLLVLSYSESVTWVHETYGSLHFSSLLYFDNEFFFTASPLLVEWHKKHLFSAAFPQRFCLGTGGRRNRRGNGNLGSPIIIIIQYLYSAL